MSAQTTVLEWPRTFFIDDRGEVILQEELGADLSPQARNDNDPAEAAALERGFIEVWRCGRDVLVFLRPERVSPVTLAGAIDTLARLGQDWTIVWPTAPGGRVEWFPGYTLAIRKITSMMEKAERLPPCPDYDDILAEALRFEAGRPVSVAKDDAARNTLKITPTRGCADQADGDLGSSKSGGQWLQRAVRASSS